MQAQGVCSKLSLSEILDLFRVYSISSSKLPLKSLAPNKVL